MGNLFSTDVAYLLLAVARNVEILMGHQIYYFLIVLKRKKERERKKEKRKRKKEEETVKILTKIKVFLF